MTALSKMSFAQLVDECLARGIKYTAEDTAETLRAKLSSKPAKPDALVETSGPEE